MSRGPAKGAGRGGPASGRPALGDDLRPFEPGNLAAVRHGAFSDRKAHPVADELTEGLLADRPELGAYPEIVHVWADTAARWLLLRDWLNEVGMVDDDGRLRDGALKWLNTFGRRAIELGARLGLDPPSEAQLARDRADAASALADLDGLRERGRAIRLAAEERQGLAPGDEGADAAGQPQETTDRVQEGEDRHDPRRSPRRPQRPRA